MPPTLLIDSIVRGIQVGSLYALMALGITLVMNVVRLPNFAHAEYITAGAYAALLVSHGLSDSPIVILAIAFTVTAVVALATHRLVFRPLEKQKSTIYSMLLASFAVGMILRYIIFLFVDRYDLFDKRIKLPLQIVLRTDNMILTNVFFLVVPASIILVILLTLLLNYTRIGREMRAVENNLDLAKIIGIRVERVKDLTWLLAGGLAGTAGALWGIYSSVNPLTGWSVILSVFAASIMGGFSSFFGTILGAYIVSFSENTLMQVLNFHFGLDFTFKPAIPFIIIILVLLIRPQGLTDLFHRQRGLQR